MKQLRLKAQLTQEQLADELGLDVRTIRRIEAGAKPSQLAKKAIQEWIEEVKWQDAMATKRLQDRKE